MRKLSNRVRFSFWAAAAVALAAWAASFVEVQAPTAADDSLGHLPLVERPSAGAPQALAIVLSGDGGWRAIEERITRVLTDADIGVVGLDSLRYFWSTRKPGRVARDLDRIIGHYGTAWRVNDVLLIGYSFGADVLPAAVDRMDPVLRGRIIQISLLGLAPEAEFEFHVGNWLGLRSADARPVAPDAERLNMTKVQCVYGGDEDESLCRDAIFRVAELIETPGGHHFDGDYEALARRLLDGYVRRRTW